MILGILEGDLQASRGSTPVQVCLRAARGEGIHEPVAADCNRGIRVFVGNRI